MSPLAWISNSFTKAAFFGPTVLGRGRVAACKERRNGCMRGARFRFARGGLLCLVCVVGGSCFAEKKASLALIEGQAVAAVPVNQSRLRVQRVNANLNRCASLSGFLGIDLVCSQKRWAGPRRPMERQTLPAIASADERRRRREIGRSARPSATKQSPSCPLPLPSPLSDKADAFGRRAQALRWFAPRISLSVSVPATQPPLLLPSFS